MVSDVKAADAFADYVRPFVGVRFAVRPLNRPPSGYTTVMKSISAAIIVLAGAATLVAGAFHPHNETQLLVCAIGIGLAVVGLVGWWSTLRGGD